MNRSAIDFAWLAIFEKQVNPNTLRYLQDEFLRNNHDSLDEYEFPVAHRIVLGLETRDLNAMLSEAPYSVINSKDSFGKTALLWASRRGDLEAVQLLLRHGADPNVSDAVRRSPLHMAARSRSVPLIETLIKYGADPRAVNFLNEMPAHYACYEEDSERLVQPFVRSGIDINLASKFGRRLLDIAVQWKYPILVNFLLSCGAKPEASNSHDWKQKLFGRAVISSASDVLEILLRHLGVPTMIDDKGENFLHFLAREADRDFLLHIKVFTVEPHTAEALSHESQRPIDLARSRSDEDFARAFETFLQKLRGVSTQFVGESTHA